jgi:paraquat-inducible protein A
LILPFVTVSKFGNERISFVITGAEALSARNMHALGTWVAVCAVLAPGLLLGFLLLGCMRDTLNLPAPGTLFASRAVHAIQEWSMPEVHVLAVLVAFFKLGSLVDVDVGAGMYCYAAASVLMLMAWRCFTLAPEAAVQAELTVGGET